MEKPEEKLHEAKGGFSQSALQLRWFVLLRECGYGSRAVQIGDLRGQRLHGVRSRSSPGCDAMFWKNEDGRPYGFLQALPQRVDEHSGPLLFATNAGMFDPNYKPVGLYIENGRELVHVNTRSGAGNFHLKPNGVFFVAGEASGCSKQERTSSSTCDRTWRRNPDQCW